MKLHVSSVIDASVHRISNAAPACILKTRKIRFITFAPIMAIVVSLAATSLPVQAQVSGVSDFPTVILQQLGFKKLRDLCYAKCDAVLDDEISICNDAYPFPERFTDDRHEYAECVGLAIADYNNCTQKCPPFGQVIDNPFDSGQ